MSAGPTLVLATGGTGGHVFPALAVAEAAQRDGVTVLVLGQRGGMEERLSAEAGVPFHGVSAGKWHRGRPSPRQALQAAAGVVEAWQLLRRQRPKVVVGFGGFASYPGAFAATRLGIPLALHEGNAYPSQVNRWLAGSAALLILAQEQALQHLPRARRSVSIPFPVRERRVDRGAARAAFGLEADAVVTLVMGGSQGSATLNTAVPQSFSSLAERFTSLSVLHSAGRGRSDAVSVAQELRGRYQVVDFLDAATAWATADMAITRAGVGTLSEAAFNGVPLLMVPLPSSAEDHQLHNAMAVAEAGAGIVVEERDLAGLTAAWEALLDPPTRQAAAAAATARTPVGAARRILEAVMELK
ncbi:MAG TPA: UDP-N-acetylglucosamine--N-acetylmuramyl-(pentapeptide) pyrophosphoryl-undecaprenol N-acetylglucosamine transferase [Trueperaceae bacterium]|nr:UDP-N-acetylglucosamine--N-acetylmuramyl-(pentapeptide) pyrophosphoryl-undecaprenol N-acetylglucosamine transferase [Trueperaceae bacterium]